MRWLWLFPAIAVFILYFAIEIPLEVFGLIALLVYFCWAPSEVMPSPEYDGRPVDAFRVRWFQALWGNWQNGIRGAQGDDLPAGWPKLGWSRWLQILAWSGWRNKVGNERWIEPLGAAVYPARVVICFSSSTPVNLRFGYFLVRQGWRFQLRFSWSATRQFRMGWGLAEQGSVVDCPAGVGFSFEPFATA